MKPPRNLPRNFRRDDCGALIEPVPGLPVTYVHDLLPDSLRAHPAAVAFVEGVIEHAADVAAQEAADITPAATQARLREVDLAAHKMQHELHPLAGASATFAALDAQFLYLRMRAREGAAAPQEGRPEVPGLPADVPDLPALLERIDGDLQALRIACCYTAERITPKRSTPKDRERGLVRGIACLFRHHFGELPPKRGWFAEVFIATVADQLKLVVGHHVVGEVVGELR